MTRLYRKKKKKNSLRQPLSIISNRNVYHVALRWRITVITIYLLNSRHNADNSDKYKSDYHKTPMRILILTTLVVDTDGRNVNNRQNLIYIAGFILPPIGFKSAFYLPLAVILLFQTLR